MKPGAPQSVDFEFPPAVGTVVMFHGQRYELVDLEPYIRRDGAETTLLVWASHCARCADPMRIKSTVKSKALSRRCSECAQKGVPA